MMQKLFPSAAMTNSFGERQELKEIFRKGTSAWDGGSDGLKASLVVFYPFSFSPVCSGELGALDENSGKLAERGVQIIAVCCDSVYTLRAFKESKGYRFEFLSDFWPHGSLSREVGAFDEDRGISARYSFLVDRQGQVLATFSSELSAPRSIDDYFASLKKIV